jgi:hypothetical protein
MIVGRQPVIQSDALTGNKGKTITIPVTIGKLPVFRFISLPFSLATGTGKNFGHSSARAAPARPDNLQGCHVFAHFQSPRKCTVFSS